MSDWPGERQAGDGVLPGCIRFTSQVGDSIIIGAGLADKNADFSVRRFLGDWDPSV